MQLETILFDSDAFVGYTVGTDDHHSFMVEYVKKMVNPDVLALTTSGVVFETASLLSRRFHHSYAREFLKFLEASQMHIVELTRDDRLAAQQLFTEQLTAHESLIDCVNVIVARKLGIKEMASFDTFYGRFELKYLRH